MGLIDRLFGRRDASPQVVATEVARPRRQIVDARNDSDLPTNAVLLGGQGRVEVRGESHYQDALDEICGGKCEEGHGRKVYALLEAEPENPHDSGAIVVRVDGHKVGYVAREIASEYQPLMRLLVEKDKVAAVRAFIRGGWLDDEGEGHYGIELELSSVDALMKTRKVQALL